MVLGLECLIVAAQVGDVLLCLLGFGHQRLQLGAALGQVCLHVLGCPGKALLGFVQRLERSRFIRFEVMCAVLRSLQAAHVNRPTSELDISPLQITEFTDT